MLYNQRNAGLTLLEFVISLIIILIFVAAFLVYIYKASIIVREKVLQIELKSLRQTLILYKATQSGYPIDLKVFMQAKYKQGTVEEVIFGKEFLASIATDQEGYPIDSFGNRFYYDARSGKLHSSTKGYTSW
jgi:type II secretory pathway pseudopilin PulG